MIDVLIALFPAIVAGVYFYGFSVVNVLLGAVAASVVAEVLFNIVTKRKQTVKDLSAVVTGVMIALILPPYIPVWVAAIGAIFATVVVKLFFGGLGNNFMNPAGAAKAMLIASWTALMIKPAGFALANPAIKTDSALLSLIAGQAKGNIGEASIAAILLGGLYLILRKKISIITPFFAVLAAAIFAAILGKNVQTTVLTGAFFFAAFFMATEPHTTPSKFIGKAIFGTLFGIVSIIFMVFGYNPDGPFYAVIFLNLFTAVINHFTESKIKKEAA